MSADPRILQLQRRRSDRTAMLSSCLVVVLALAAGSARAADPIAGDGASAEAPPGQESRQVAVSSSAVASMLGEGSVSFNATLAPFGNIDDSGFRLRLSAGDSWYRFVTADAPRTFGSGHTRDVGLQAGYQLSLERMSFVGVAGPVFAESISRDESRSRVGVKTDLSMYATPTDQTMFYGSASYSTLGDAVLVQAKYGWKLPGELHLGPEASLSWRDALPSYGNVAVMRIGGHISGLPVGSAQFGLSSGWTHVHDLGSGVYGGANLYWTF
jgi:hypothetical protein